MLISNYENDSWRSKRIEKCMRLWIAIMGVSRVQASQLIYSLHDYKGDLHVLWLHEPTERQKMAFAEAWGECGESIVRHSTDTSTAPYVEV